MGEILRGFYQFERQCMGFRFRLQNFRHLHGKFIRLHSWRLVLLRTDCPRIWFTEPGHNFICGPSQASVALSILVCCGLTVWGFSFNSEAPWIVKAVCWNPHKAWLCRTHQRLTRDTPPARSLLRGVGGLLRVEAAKPGTLLLMLTAQSSSSSKESLVNTHIQFQRQLAGWLPGRARREETLVHADSHQRSSHSGLRREVIWQDRWGRQDL